MEAPPTRVDATAVRTGRSSHTVAASACQHHRSILVDDRRLVRDSLQVKSYQTIVAETGEEGVHLAHERQSALILMDVPLQGVNGVEALHRLRADPSTSRTPVIAVTASVMTQDQTRIMAAGFDGFHGKPISVRQLLATVREILDKP